MPQITFSDIVSILATLISVVQGCSLTPIVQDPNRFATWFTVSAHVVDPGAQVQFTDSSQYTGETAIAWNWDFGNGQTATEQAPVATYETSGLYDVTLTVTCQSGTILTHKETNIICVRDPNVLDGHAAGDQIVISGIEMVWVPPGTFVQGDASTSAETDEQPQRTVTFTRGFWMGKYELTQAQWESVLFRQPSWFVSEAGDTPVELVHWEDVQRFLKYLTNISPGTFRLPTEAEWEYACRAGATTEWSFGDDADALGRYAWFAGNAGNSTHPVGRLEPNAWGLYDMVGNVNEWVHDYYAPDAYQEGDATDPLYQKAERFRNVRGGSWTSPVHQTRSAYRDYYVPTSRYNSIGLRVVCN